MTHMTDITRQPFHPLAPFMSASEEPDKNPNWPSKTGNPSGDGRGNNPPKPSVA